MKTRSIQDIDFSFSMKRNKCFKTAMKLLLKATQTLFNKFENIQERKSVKLTESLGGWKRVAASSACWWWWKAGKESVVWLQQQRRRRRRWRSLRNEEIMISSPLSLSPHLLNENVQFLPPSSIDWSMEKETREREGEKNGKKGIDFKRREDKMVEKELGSFFYCNQVLCGNNSL